MSGQVYTVFDLVTRLPVRSVSCRPDALPAYVAEGQIAITGRHREMRLNDANEPEPDTNRAASRAREQKRSARMVRIEELERKQARRVREILAAQDPQLKAIDDEIAALRARLTDGT